MNTIPQYAKTEHPDTITAYNTAKTQYRAYRERVDEFCEFHGLEGRLVTSGGFVSGSRVVGLEASVAPFGWVRGGRGLFVPSPRSKTRRVFDGLRYAPHPIPGRPTVLSGRGPGGEFRVDQGSLSMVAGVLYSGVRLIPEDVAVEPLWVPISRAEFLTATSEPLLAAVGVGG